jgi:hypothetical protein
MAEVTVGILSAISLKDVANLYLPLTFPLSDVLVPCTLCGCTLARLIPRSGPQEDHVTRCDGLCPHSAVVGWLLEFLVVFSVRRGSSKCTVHNRLVNTMKRCVPQTTGNYLGDVEAVNFSRSLLLYAFS